jgi:hypothetical protein
MSLRNMNDAENGKEQIVRLNRELENDSKAMVIAGSKLEDQQIVSVLKQRAVILERVIRRNPAMALDLVLSPQSRIKLAKQAGTGDLVESMGEWQGRLELLTEDDFTSGKSRTFYSLSGVHGDFEVYFAGKAPAAGAGTTVSISGMLLGRTLAASQWQVDETAALTASAAPACSTIGEQRTVVLLVSMPTKPLLSLVTSAMMQQAYFGSGLSLNTYLQETSYGKAWATGDVFGTIVLDADYIGQPEAVRDAAIRVAAGFVDFQKYNRIALVVPQAGTGLTSGGLGTIGCSQIPLYPSGSINASTSWLGDASMGSEIDLAATAIHEMGHNLGLEHARAADFGEEPLGPLGQLPAPWDELHDYGDSFSNMGRGLGQWAAPHKFILGWLQEGVDFSNIETSGDFPLYPYEESASLPKALRVRRGTGNDTWLWLENRQPLGAYDSTLPATAFTGALIHYEDRAWEDVGATNLLRFNADSGGLLFGNPPLSAGSNWTDPYSNLAISLSRSQSNSIQISVSYAPAPVCPGSLSPSKLNFEASGGAASINVVAPSGCSWTAISSLPWIQISSGASGTGSGVIGFSVLATDVSADRWGRIAVGSAVAVVTQDGLAGNASISPASAEFAATGGAGEIAISTNTTDFAWNFWSNASWIQSVFVSRNRSVGPSILRYIVAQNTSPVQRTGTISVAGLTFAITQAAGTSTVSRVIWKDSSYQDAPMARHHMASATFASQGESLLYGGIWNTSFFSDTWVWNGVVWTQKYPNHNPGTRSGHSMVYDAAHDQIVLFGGYNPSSGYLNDTWIWDGTDWRQLHPQNNPPPRTGPAMAYHAASGKVILFGGNGNEFGFLSDTWEWDGSDWTRKLSPTSPTARQSPSVAYDAAREETVIFGGFYYDYLNGSPIWFADTWVWNGNEWRLKAPSVSPSPREDAGMAYNPALGKVIMVGGYGGSIIPGSTYTYEYREETWTWNGTDWEQLFPDASPEFSWSYSMFYDPVQKTFAVHLGDNLRCADRGPKTYALEAGAGAILLDSYSAEIPAAGGQGSIAVTAGVGWDATSEDSWIAITSSGSGNGNGSIQYKLLANPSAEPREGTIQVGAQVFSVRQAGKFMQPDFNGDAKPDILWRNSSTGEVYVWYMDGATRSGGGYLQNIPDPNCKIVGMADFNQDGRVDILCRNSATGENYVWFMYGTYSIGSAYLDQVKDVNWTVAGVEDFNNDGSPDILWRNASTGENYVWSMSKANHIDGAYLASVADACWTIAGLGDFNNDGKPDILWRHRSTGEIYVWFMNGTTGIGGAYLDSVPNLNWKIVSVGDYNSDGQADILWRNTATGENYIWFMNGVIIGRGEYLDRVSDSKWRLSDKGECALGADFDNDDNADLLWRNESTGENYVWFMNGKDSTGGAYLDPVPDANWKAVGLADFNQDGKVDILWRNAATGENYAWFMSGKNRTGGAYLDTVLGASWKIVATADFNKDGKVDILWRNFATGENYVWFMNGTTHSGGAYLNAVEDLNWKIVGTGDFNRDGKTDILWRNISTGENYIWYMDGTSLISGDYIDPVPDQKWKVAAIADFNKDRKADILWRNESTGENYVWYMNGITHNGGDYLPPVSGPNWRIAPDGH